MASNLEQYVRQAKNGDRQALETVVCRIQDKIFGLALRVLGNPDDAEDEAQEILIKVITHLSDYREESAFSSWVYRIACNHLLTTRNRKNERMGMTFDLLEGLFSAEAENAHPLAISGPERDVLLEETRHGLYVSSVSRISISRLFHEYRERFDRMVRRVSVHSEKREMTLLLSIQ